MEAPTMKNKTLAALAALVLVTAIGKALLGPARKFIK